MKLTVLSPLSAVPVNKGNAPRFDTLNGKTVGEVWATGHYGADVTFPVFRRLLQERYPDVKIVPFSEFEIGKPKATERWGPIEKTAEILRAKGCDAVLVGNGG